MDSSPAAALRIAEDVGQTGPRAVRRDMLAGLRTCSRRLRWRQWWERNSHLPVSTSPPDYNMSIIEQPEHSHLSGTQFDSPSESGVMQAEIRGLRQALAYVRELVHIRSADWERNGPYSPRIISNHETADLPGRSAHTDASSTAGLSTVLSTGTSSLLSLDSPSSVTVDTLESAGTTAPPSYHAGVQAIVLLIFERHPMLHSTYINNQFLFHERLKLHRSSSKKAVIASRYKQ